MNWSRPPPEPIASYETVALEFWSSNLAVQASCAACWALEPAPAIVPESPDELPLDPHAATPRARTPEAAETSHHFLVIESLLFRFSKGRRLRGSPPSDPVEARHPVSGHGRACYVVVVEM